TFKAACVLVQDFQLTDEQAWPLLLEWNQGCVPPWGGKELRRKLNEAREKGRPREGFGVRRPADEGGPGGGPGEGPGSRYVARLPDGRGGGAAIRDVLLNKALTNFALTLDEELEVQDDFEARREFAGRLVTPGRDVPFRIAAGDYADNGKLKAALFEAGGCD